MPVTDVVLGILAGPMAAAGLAKLVSPAEKLQWPIRHPVLRAPHGPKLVGVAEFTVAAIAILASERWAAVAVAVAYASLAAVAFWLRGQKCACFGAARLAAVGRTHVSLNAVGAVVAAMVVVAGGAGPSSTVTRLGVTAGAAVGIFGLILILDRRREAAAMATPPCDERIYGVRMYEAEDCPACRALKELIGKMDPIRHRTIEKVTVAMGEKLPAEVEGLGIPCAVGLDAGGKAVCVPAEGIGAVKRLIESVTIPTTAVASDG
ncbi:hypothetical protein GCM10010517_03230 [Streptosporangium fragile]|uniref:Methylamine utilization protein MauE n=1 Tax=Streptosporangium fragile TaxID=46186 RepID=A0ABN3VRQ4_9ACTN